MANNNGDNKRRTIGEYTTSTAKWYATSMVQPPILANTFEIKQAFLHLVQCDRFRGHPSKEPNLYISNFL